MVRLLKENDTVSCAAYFHSSLLVLITSVKLCPSAIRYSLTSP